MTTVLVRLGSHISVHPESARGGRSGASPKPLAIGCRTSPTNESPPRIQAFSCNPAAGPHERRRESPGPTLMRVFLEFSDEN